MGRTPRYTHDSILDAALELAAQDGAPAVTVVAIAARLGAPSGSIYHRFASRDLVLAMLWVRSIRRFQEGFLAALALDDPTEAAHAAALHTLEWSDTHRAEARIMLMYRRDDLAARWPDELGEQLAELNDPVARGLTELVRARYGTVDRAAMGQAEFALVTLPYAAARQYLVQGASPPSWLPAAVLAAVDAVLAGVDAIVEPAPR